MARFEMSIPEEIDVASTAYAYGYLVLFVIFGGGTGAAIAVLGSIRNHWLRLALAIGWGACDFGILFTIGLTYRLKILPEEISIFGAILLGVTCPLAYFISRKVFAKVLT